MNYGLRCCFGFQSSPVLKKLQSKKGTIGYICYLFSWVHRSTERLRKFSVWKKILIRQKLKLPFFSSKEFE